MKRKKLLSGLLAAIMVLSLVPAYALASTGTASPSSLETAANEAEAAANAAKAALNAVGTATSDLGDKEKAVEDAAKDAANALDAAITTNGAAESEMTKILNDIKDATTSDGKVKAIDEAIKVVNNVIDGVNDAVAAAEDVVTKAEEVTVIAKGTAMQANTAVDEANKALAAAENAEQLYHEILQETVDGNPGAYRILAEAENKMNAAWNSYAEKQWEADNLMTAAQALRLEAAQAQSAAVKTVQLAYEEAEAAQDIADQLFAEWEAAEKVMQAALTATGDADIQKLEAYRAKARDAALSAQQDARQAIEKAVEVYIKAQKAVDIANEAVDDLSNESTEWSDEALFAALKKAVETSPVPDERDWSKLNDRKDKPGMAGKPYAVSFGHFSPGSQHRKGDDLMNPTDSSISGYLPGTENTAETKAHSFLRLFNGDNRQDDVGYSVNMPYDADLDYVMFKLHDGTWFVWSNEKATDIANFATVKKFESLTADKNASNYNFAGTGKENAIKVTEIVAKTIWGMQVQLTYTTKYWVEKTDQGYEIHFENLNVQNQREAPKGTPGYQMDCVLGEERIDKLYLVYGDMAIRPPLDLTPDPVSKKAEGITAPGDLALKPLSKLTGLGTLIQVPDPGPGPGPGPGTDIPLGPGGSSNIPLGSGIPLGVPGTGSRSFTARLALAVFVALISVVGLLYRRISQK